MKAVLTAILATVGIVALSLGDVREGGLSVVVIVIGVVCCFAAVAGLIAVLRQVRLSLEARADPTRDPRISASWIMVAAGLLSAVAGLVLCVVGALGNAMQILLLGGSFILAALAAFVVAWRVRDANK